MSLLVVNDVVKGGNHSVTDSGRPAETRYLQNLAKNWFDSREELSRRNRERQYRYVKQRIIFEEFLNPVDYELQLFLFNGEFRFGMVFFRQFHHKELSYRLYDKDWELREPGSQRYVHSFDTSGQAVPPPPQSIMDSLKALCHSIDQVRADFYVCDGRYYFSEFTFTHNAGGAGMIGKYDAELGRYWL